MAMAKAWRMPSWVALALLVALLAAAMEHSLSLAEEEQGGAEPTPTAPEDAAAAADAPEEAAADVPAAAATEAGEDDGAPAPAPASQEAAEETPSSSIGAKAKAGFHQMMEGLSASKAKLECKIMGNCPTSD